jgi:hypothetical protein
MNPPPFGGWWPRPRAMPPVLESVISRFAEHDDSRHTGPRGKCFSRRGSRSRKNARGVAVFFVRDPWNPWFRYDLSPDPQRRPSRYRHAVLDLWRRRYLSRPEASRIRPRRFPHAHRIGPAAPGPARATIVSARPVPARTGSPTATSPRAGPDSALPGGKFVTREHQDAAEADRKAPGREVFPGNSSGARARHPTRDSGASRRLAWPVPWGSSQMRPRRMGAPRPRHPAGPHAGAPAGTDGIAVASSRPV